MWNDYMENGYLKPYKRKAKHQIKEMDQFLSKTFNSLHILTPNINDNLSIGVSLVFEPVDLLTLLLFFR
jgi:hypothetical protein